MWGKIKALPKKLLQGVKRWGESIYWASLLCFALWICYVMSLAIHDLAVWSGYVD